MWKKISEINKDSYKKVYLIILKLITLFYRENILSKQWKLKLEIKLLV